VGEVYLDLPVNKNPRFWRGLVVIVMKKKEGDKNVIWILKTGGLYIFIFWFKKRES